MKIIIIYASETHKNKDLLETILKKDFEILYIKTFNLEKLRNIIIEYEYICFLNDNTNYLFDELVDDIKKTINIIKSTDKFDQILFYNFEYADIDHNITNYNKEYIENEINILNETRQKKNYHIDYNNYRIKNFNRLFLPSFIKVTKLLEYNDILINHEHYELNFIRKIFLQRYYLNNDKKFIIIPNIQIEKNINNDLSIVTGFIKLNEKKIQKYEKQKYEYLDKCIDTLKIDINMIIYIQEELYDHIYEIRKNYNLIEKTKIIKIDPEKYLYQYDKLNIIEENVKKNHINYSSAKKILSVLTRYNYLTDSISNNYFNSKYFAWLDFSAGHIVKIPDKIIFNNNFNNKIKIGWMARSKSNNFSYNWKVLAGGFFIGNKKIILELIKLHKFYFEILMNWGYTINDDKLLFFIYENNPYLFETYFSDYSNIILKII